MAEAEIVYRSRGFETFKEEISEEVGQRGKSLGVGQETLSTIEIGLSPFVPFSERYKMEARELPSNGWGVGAKHGPEDKDWEEGPMAEARQSLSRNIKKAPGDKMKEAADDLARLISGLLYDEGITREANTSVMEEIQSNALAMFITQKKGWGTKKWRDKAAAVGEVEMIQSKHLKALGGETFDMWAKNKAARTAVDMSLNMLFRQTEDASFIKGVRALETTTMVGEKFFQQMKVKWTGTIPQQEKRLAKAANKEIQKVLKKYNALTKGLLHAHEKTPKPPTETKGKESQAYFARQLFSRLFEFQHQLMQGDEGVKGGDLGEAYIFAYPLSGDPYTSAYIRIQPFFAGKADGRKLESVKTTAHLVGGSSFKEIAKGRTFDSANPTKAAVFFLATKVTYAAHTQIMIMDLIERNNFTKKEEIEIAMKMSQIAADQEVLKSGRGQMIGVGLDNEFATTLGNITEGSFAVEGAELLAKKDAADALLNQVKFIIGKAKGKLAPEIKSFYEQAMIESNKVTDSWIGDIDGDVRLTDTPQGPYAAASAGGMKGLFTSEESLAGIGIPFWFTIGRDPAGYQKFKLRQTFSGLSGTMKYTEEGIALKEASRFAEPLSVIRWDGEGKRPPSIRGPKGGMPSYPAPMNRDWGSSPWQTADNQPKAKLGVEADYGFYKGGRQLAHDPVTKVITGTGGFTRSVKATSTSAQIDAARQMRQGATGRTLREILESDRTHHSYSQPRDKGTGRYL